MRKAPPQAEGKGPRKLELRSVLEQELFSAEATKKAAGMQSGPSKIAHTRVVDVGQEDVRRSREKAMFKLDTKSHEFEAFSLPPRPEATTIIKLDNKTHLGKAKKTQAADTAETNVQSKAEGEYAFLPAMMGRPASPRKKDPSEVHVAQGGNGASGGKGSSTSDLDEVSVILEKLKTGEDAINFFARYGSDTPVKFVRMVRVDDLKEYKPYDLVAPTNIDENSEHYSISSSGIVYVCPGQVSECYSLSNWMRQSMLFRILRNIPFYRYFLHRKTFNTWKDNVRYQHYLKNRKKVTDRLFLTRKTSCLSILAIKRNLRQIQNAKLLQNDLNRLEKETFNERQNAQLNNALALFEEAMGHVDNEVKVVIDSINSMHDQALQDPAKDAMYGDGEQMNKMTSMNKVKEEKKSRKLARQRAKLEYSTLPEFIRYVDYLSVETLADVAIGTSTSFLQEFKNSVFVVTVHLTESGQAFAPTQQEIRDVLSKMLDSMIGQVAQVPRVYHYLGKFGGSGGHAPNLQTIVRESKVFKEAALAIDRRVVAHFEEAAKKAQEFEIVRPIYEFNENWNSDDFKVADHNYASLHKWLNDLASWSLIIAKQVHNVQQGVLYLSNSAIKTKYEPILRERQREIKEFIKFLARSRCDNQLQKYRDLLKKIEKQPNNLRDYVAYFQAVKAMKDDQNALHKDTSGVDQLFQLLEEEKEVISYEDKGQHETLGETQTKYRRDVHEAEAYRDSKQQEMISNVETNLGTLQDNLVKFSTRLSDAKFVGTEAFSAADTVLEDLKVLGHTLGQHEHEAKRLADYQTLFGVPIAEQKDLDEGRTRFEDLTKLWELTMNWNILYQTWTTSQFTDLNAEDMERQIKDYFSESSKINKKLATNKVAEMLKDKVSVMKDKLEVLTALGNANLRARHWDKIFQLIGEKYYEGREFTLQYLMEHNIFDFGEEVMEISGIASGEAGLEQSLEKIEQGWESIEFVVNTHRDQQGLYILGTLDDITTLLEDNQVLLQTMLGSNFVKGIQDSVELWAKKLATLAETLEEWILCQRTWMYLENIFGAEDIQKQLPAESQKFLVVDRAWKQIMTRTFENPLVMNALKPMEGSKDGGHLLDIFKQNNDSLDAIQKSLEAYLETKRMAFPRFYFLSNDDLLEILSQTRDPNAVQPHMNKCFDAIKSIKFGEGRNSAMMQGFNDPSGEFVPLEDHVKAEGPVENWLSGFEDGMRASLYAMAKHAYVNYPATDEGAINRKEWLFGKYPAQVVIAVDQVTWTERCGDSISAIAGVDGAAPDPDAMKKFLDFSLKQIDAMVQLVRTNLGKLERVLIGALLTIDVHARDVTRALVNKGTAALSDFEWTRQLRYYWDTGDDDIFARQTNSSFRYGYEYLGNGPRLVITPLTDICYMTLTGALHMRLGGAPAGPAGTGKTETTKDLAKALAVYCVVFNCSDGLDYKIMGRFFSGLAQQGAWACFDEFNRIDVEVLSVIAQQVLSIQQAIMKRAKEMNFEGQIIPVNFAFGVFITMNPGYAGRTELPDNLKSLFRPVAMMVPDYRLIAEIMLFAEGFADALPLSNKMAQLYALSSEQLSKQSHYDFGMRAVKSVLVAAGQLKRKEPETNENILLIRAMRDSNVPKFLQQDLPLFAGILMDLFPGITVPYVDYGKLKVAIEKTIETMSLQKPKSFVEKVIQVHETQLVRHGVMVVGESGSGKTKNVLVLAQALGLLNDDGVIDRDNFYKHVDRLVLNPKSITAGELYGEFNPLTNEWKNGVVPQLVTDCVDDANNEIDRRKWIIFDGPVDAVWIENMNTVLDDNKTLCLANSKRIKLPGTLHMMFEVQDLKVASPATVSRCGMVFMEQEHVGMLNIVKSWAATFLKNVAGTKNSKTISETIEAHLEAAIDFIRRNCTEKVATSNNQLTTSLLNLIASRLMKISDENERKLAVQDTDLMNALLVWSFVWSIGANIVDASRAAFSEWFRNRFSSLLSARYSSLLDDIYNCYVDLIKQEIKPWSSLMSEFNYDAKLPYFSILVPTVDTTRYRFLLDNLMNNGHNVLFMAETGVGKSVVINAFLNDMVATGSAVSYVVGYSAQTKPANLRDVFESKLESKRKGVLGAPTGKKMFMFIDDLNMPALETYGAQPPNELLRQAIDQGGFYEVGKRIFFKNVQDVIFVSACAPPGGGRNEVSPRLLRHFHMVWLTNLTEDSMIRIFKSIVQGFLHMFLPDIEDLGETLVKSSVNIYGRIQMELLPTPLRSHYTFNLRDLSKIFQGMLMVKPKFHDAFDSVKEKRDSLIRLWCHEGARVFRDRLINKDDRDWYNNAVLTQLHATGSDDWKIEDFAECMYGDFGEKNTKDYKELPAPEKIMTILDDFLGDFNNEIGARPMDLVFFKDAVHHVARIARVLSQPRGNALLVGVGGSGRQSLTKISSYMAGYKIFQIEITRGYGMVEWHDKLKEILMTAGAKNQPTVFLFSDTQIVLETFLEDLNNILNSGEVPNLYEADEMERIVQMTRPLAKAAGKGEGREAVLQYYVNLVRENLHIVLCMSPIGDGFRTRCRMFPSLVNCCTIDWFDPWPEDALYSVAHRIFSAQKDAGIEDFCDSLSTMCNKMHRTVEIETERFFTELKRYNYTTPTSYLELIKLYVDILKTQQQKIRGNERRYRVGLDKLQETEAMVAQLEVSITEMQPILVQAAKDTEVLLQQVAVDQKVADEQEALTTKDVTEANKVAVEVQKLKDDCQADLDEAMPAYEAAMKALDSLDKGKITELKNFPNPHDSVKFVMEAVCIFFERATEWKEAKALLSLSDIMQRMMDYDKDHIDNKIIKKIDKYVKDPRFVPSDVRSKSVAAESMCQWVIAMHKYHNVAKSIGPKIAAKEAAEAKLTETNEKLGEKKAQLQAVKDKVAGLQKTLKQTQDKKAQLEADAEIAKQRLHRAGLLIGGLGGEKIRWQASAKQLGESIINLVGDMCLAAGFLAYLGPFTSQFRIRIVKRWVELCHTLKIPASSSFDMIQALGEPVVLRGWQLDGLPADDFSCENGLLTTMGRRWALMIDPQGQANRWIRNMYSKTALHVIKLTQKDFLRTVENAIRVGQAVLLENVLQELDPSLEPVLLKSVFKRAGTLFLRLGETDVPWNNDFRFFITTKLANPHFVPEICIKVTVVNFTVTMKGLEDQLLVDVIKSERPDLEERKDKLVVSIASDQAKLLLVEEEILTMLANASGDILDDEELIQALARSKTTSSAIGVRLEEAEVTTKEINETREGYRTVATRGSILYFVVANLALIDPMYQYSLQFYKELFNQRLAKTEKREIVQERLDLLIEDITVSMYKNVCRGLFEKDKLLYSFTMATSIHLASGQIANAEWEMFLVGAVADKSVLEKAPNPYAEGEGINDRNWMCSVMLEHNLPVFEGLCTDITSNKTSWVSFFTSETPHRDPLPGEWEEKLSIFQRLLMVRVLREEKVVFAIRRYVGIALGEVFTESPPFDLNGSYEDSVAVTPLIFILSPGADPTAYLLQLAEAKEKGNNLRIISLGQGQGPIAEKHIDISQKVGDWVCLQNCHLAVSWLNKLEQIVERMQNEPDTVNAGFRLWLTSMPSKAFPVPVLQNGIKVTNEPPRGLRANLQRTFQDLSEDDYEKCTKAYPFKKLLFAVAFFNALILERRKFGAVGWNIAYDWMQSDLVAAMTQVRMYVEEQDDVPWETLNVSVSAITYGGRVTDVWDKRTIASVLSKYFTPALLTTTYKFSDCGLYYSPEPTDMDGIRSYIRSLPLEDGPEVFGLHANAAITLQQKESRSLIAALVTCAGGGGGGSGKGPDPVNDMKVAEMAKGVSARMPKTYDLRSAHPETFKKKGDAVISLGVFLGQEIVRFNGLIEVMVSTLAQLQRAIKGEVVMSGELEVMYGCFIFQKTPPAWEAAGYPCLKPLANWVEDFFGRIEFMGKWLTEGPRPAYWLPGFFFPQGFMTAVKQTYSRDERIAVDTLKIGCEVTHLDSQSVDVPPAYGAFVFGMYLEGGRFDRNLMRIEDLQPRQLLDLMPCIWLKPVIATDYNPTAVYNCPLYKTSIRAGTLSTTGHSTNFVVALPIPTHLEQDYWVRRGCAMLCMTDD